MIGCRNLAENQQGTQQSNMHSISFNGRLSKANREIIEHQCKINEQPVHRHGREQTFV